MPDIISNFRLKYRFLSNFYPVRIEYDGIIYNNSEAAFQAQKCTDQISKLQFSSYTPYEAKRIGRTVELRPDWEKVKDDLMFEIVLAKFTQHPDLKEKLLDTGDAILIEGNTWHDTYWGVDSKTGKGQNHLGKILMRVRQELR